MKNCKRIFVLALALAMLLALAAPAVAAGNGITISAGHEVLAKLPAGLQKPARPTTLEQAEGRVNSRMVTVENEEEQKAEYREWYRDAFGEEPTEEQVASSTIACPKPWTLSVSKESVFQEMVKLTDSLTADKAADTEKAKAIFDWVSQNVKYDYTAFQYAKRQEAGYALSQAQEKRLNEAGDPFYVYAQKLGVCGGQAALCWLMCSIAEIPAVYIVGESNDKALGGAGPHGWNAALLDGRWLFFDATWNVWDMAPSYHNTTEGFAYCDGVFQLSDGMEENSASYWLCPGFTCPASVTVPEGVFHVMAESFKNCTTLRSITLPSTLTSVETEAFMGCTGLESITIPAGVEYVHWRSFKDCTNLRSVTFQGRTEVREGAFDGTPMVEDAKEFAIVGGVLVKYKGNAKEVTIPAGVTAIAEKAFYGHYDRNALNKVVIPEGVVSIGESAFNGFRFLRDVTIPASVTDIGGSAFDGTAWLKNQGDWPVFSGILLAYQGPDVESVTVPDGVREISNYAFYHNGSNIRSITFPASLKKIGHNMLSHSYLKEVYFGGTKEQWDQVEIVRNGCTNWVLRDEDSTVVFHFDFAYPIPSSGTAYPSTQTVDIDGKKVEFQMYALKDANGYPTNYIKARDLALALNSTQAQFAIEWDGRVNLVAKSSYTLNGSENKTPFSGERAYTIPKDPTSVNGSTSDLTAIFLTDDDGGGYTYYQLRDLGRKLGFNVGWSGERGAFIETDRPYSGK